MTHIVIQCRCEFRIEVEDSRGCYVHRGGRPDALGRIFQIEVTAQRLLEIHQNCCPKATRAEVAQRAPAANTPGDDAIMSGGEA
jgi:hypothetical protein